MRQRHLAPVLAAVAGIALAGVLAAPAQAASSSPGKPAANSSHSDDSADDRNAPKPPPTGDGHGGRRGDDRGAPPGDDRGDDAPPADDRADQDGTFHSGGAIIAVDADAGTVTLSRPAGADDTGESTETLTVSSHATVTLDGATVTLADLPVGARLRATGTEDSDKTRTATAIDALTSWPLHLEGTLTGVDTAAGTLTLMTRDGRTVTVPVDADVPVKLDCSDSTLSAVTAGVLIHLEGTETLTGQAVTTVDARTPKTAQNTPSSATKAAAAKKTAAAKKAAAARAAAAKKAAAARAAAAKKAAAKKAAPATKGTSK